jgi:hypothetical protein
LGLLVVVVVVVDFVGVWVIPLLLATILLVIPLFLATILFII